MAIDGGETIGAPSTWHERRDSFDHGFTPRRLFPGRPVVAFEFKTVATDYEPGVGQPEPIKESGMDVGNRLIAADLIESIEKDRQPLGSIYDGQASLEMILAVYESHKQDRPVDLPLKNRRHPLA